METVLGIAVPLNTNRPSTMVSIQWTARALTSHLRSAHAIICGTALLRPHNGVMAGDPSLALPLSTQRQSPG
ncbi:hypothetical protein KIN20_033169 [Parelaphostrongylus tenuis]|uniref:Uncharacterized protein n=1 Tax=Parelaphostrongylus tenuis TaxID=148309 RepID=A0AAD5WIN1_PARTN|nr:hypothetical protein KIN20_033169 [Parelaphostrongylus tenuis]